MFLIVLSYFSTFEQTQENRVTEKVYPIVPISLSKVRKTIKRTKIIMSMEQITIWRQGSSYY